MKRESKIINLANKNRRNKVFMVLIGLIVFTGLVFLVSALTNAGNFAKNEERSALQNELNSLTSELNTQGYSWLVDFPVNYSIDYSDYPKYNEDSRIEIYRQNSNELISSIENISSEGFYKTYLGGLKDKSEKTFDLKILNNPVALDYITDPEINPAVESGLVALYHFDQKHVSSGVRALDARESQQNLQDSRHNNSAYGENDE